MQPFPHHYEVRLSGGPEGYAKASSEGLPDLSCEAPKDFDGPGDAWSPEHMLLSSVSTCFLFTLRSVAKLSKFQFKALEMSAEGTLDRKEGATRFTEIVLRPRLTLAPEAHRDRVRNVDAQATRLRGRGGRE